MRVMGQSLSALAVGSVVGAPVCSSDHALTVWSMYDFLYPHPDWPKEFEDPEPGPHFVFSQQQIEGLARFATAGTGSVAVEFKGSGYYLAKRLDPSGKVTDEHLLHAHGPT
jgi:hypothetical protein